MAHARLHLRVKYPFPSQAEAREVRQPFVRVGARLLTAFCAKMQALSLQKGGKGYGSLSFLLKDGRHMMHAFA